MDDDIQVCPGIGDLQDHVHAVRFSVALLQDLMSRVTSVIPNWEHGRENYWIGPVHEMAGTVRRDIVGLLTFAKGRCFPADVHNNLSLLRDLSEDFDSSVYFLDGLCAPQDTEKLLSVARRLRSFLIAIMKTAVQLTV